MKAFMITGTSRGLGEALAWRLLDPEHLLFCISRSPNPQLVQGARDRGSALVYLQRDLGKTEGLPGLMEEVFCQVPSSLELLALVNNAGVLAPMKPLAQAQAGEIAGNLALNLIAPMVLTAEFLRRSQGVSQERRILNISSGAGKKPYPGWSCYCAAKAGLDLFTQTVGVEEAEVKILSLAPGVVDTQMQAEIRRTTPEDFPHVERFRGFKEEGRLLAAEFVAGKVAELLLAQEYPSGVELELRDLATSK